MTVVILRLSGLDATEAMKAAGELLSAPDKYPVLRRTLVIDDTIALLGHADVYTRLLTSKRLESLLCVAVGPRTPQGSEGQSPLIRIPLNISSRQGSAVLWVGDAHGVDCRLSSRAIANSHTANRASGLDYLVEVLSIAEVFDKVLATLVLEVPGGVASPGLRLTGTDDEASSFAAALALAAGRLTEPGSGLTAGAEQPFTSLIPGSLETVGLAENGQLAACHARVVSSASAVSKALAKPGGLLLRRGQPDIRGDMIAMGTDLRAFRDQVARLFTEADSAGDPTEAQRSRMAAAGVLVPGPLLTIAPDADSYKVSRAAVSHAVIEAVRGGDTLPQVIRQLSLTGQQLTHKGSASYLPEVEKACPASLLDRLVCPSPRPPGKAEAAVWRRELSLEEAIHAADSLAALVVTVARNEWSGGAAVAVEVTRTRIMLDGISRQLAGHATRAQAADLTGTRATRLARLSDNLILILYDLVGAVLAAEATTPSTGGKEAYERARAKTAELIAVWTRHAAESGATSPPLFATSVMPGDALADDDVAAIGEVLRHDPREEMWQLCTADDLSALNVATSPKAVAFAPRLIKVALGDTPPQDMTWAGSGQHAGLIRLVSLRPSAVSMDWADLDESVGTPAEPWS